MATCKYHCSENIDQFSPTIAAEVWELRMGDTKKRLNVYKDFLMTLLRENHCKRILDAACGTGVDSMMLLEEGFHLTSIDLSYKMIKMAQDKRWERRKEPNFDSWVIKQANWITLTEDLEDELPFDAIFCLGNSFGTLIDDSPDQHLHRKAMSNLAAMLKPGGIFVIDHHNCDVDVTDMGRRYANMYYQTDGVKAKKISVLFENGRPCSITRNYVIDTTNLNEDLRKKYRKYHGKEYSMAIFPFRKAEFHNLLEEAFGESAEYSEYADYKPLNEAANPTHYIHVVKKSSVTKV